MKAMEKKPSVSHRVSRHGLPCIARSPAAHGQRKQISQILRNNTIQAKLTIGQPNDKYEQEADRVTEQVMSMPEPKAQSHLEQVKEESGLQRSSTTLDIQRLCPECEEEVQRQPSDEIEEEEPVQTKKRDSISVQHQGEEERTQRQPSEKNGKGEISASLQNEIRSLKSTGQSLGSSERAFFEPRIGAHFNDVRIHTNPEANRLAHVLNARAFTTGKDLVFGQGQYVPNSSHGRRLLAHELVHVVQQNHQGSRSVTSKSINESTVQVETVQRASRRVGEVIYYDSKAEASRNVPKHVEPSKCFVWHTGKESPPGFPWKVISGTGCAHWVAHRLNIKKGPGCSENYAIRRGQLIEGRKDTKHTIREAKLGDIWLHKRHSGIVVGVKKSVFGFGPVSSVAVKHDSDVDEKGVVTSDFSEGDFYNPPSQKALAPSTESKAEQLQQARMNYRLRLDQLLQQGPYFYPQSKAFLAYKKAHETLNTLGETVPPEPQGIAIPEGRLLLADEAGKPNLATPDEVAELDKDVYSVLNELTATSKGKKLQLPKGNLLEQLLLWKDRRAVKASLFKTSLTDLLPNILIRGLPLNFDSAFEVKELDNPWQRLQQSSMRGLLTSGIYQLGTHPISRFNGVDLPAGTRIRFADVGRWLKGEMETRLLTIFKPNTKKFYAWDRHLPVGKHAHQKWHINQKGMHGFFGQIQHSPMTPSQISQANKLRYIKFGGRAFLIAGILIDGALLIASLKKSLVEKKASPVIAQAVRTAGTWGGAWAGAKAGCAGGGLAGIETGFGAVLFCLVGGLLGSIAGYYGADWVADMIEAK